MELKSIGMLRRIDDLGRIVIPKEIRRSLGIKEGDPLEVYSTNDGGIYLKLHEVNYCKDCSSFIESKRYGRTGRCQLEDDLEPYEDSEGCYRFSNKV